MGNVTVDGNTFEVYGDLAGAKVYVAGLVTQGAIAWRAKTDNEKSRFLVSARYYLDQQQWEGAKTVSSQTLDWPRTGADYADGTAVDSATIPTEVIQAEYEMACVLSAAADAYSAANSGSNTKKLKAGPLEVEYFTSTLSSVTTTKLPSNVMNLVGQFLSSSGGPRGGVSSGASCDSSFTDCDTYSRSGPF